MPAKNVGNNPPGTALATGFHTFAAALPKFPAANRMLFRLFDESVMSCV
ncbi:hypothetical protein [Mycolicibacterium conceptionense]|nr:hypothetical protein [Mycolicibacterium conceptionense]